VAWQATTALVTVGGCGAKATPRKVQLAVADLYIINTTLTFAVGLPDLFQFVNTMSSDFMH